MNGAIGKGMDFHSKAILTREAIISKEPENANREVCFLIERNTICLEQVLVDFHGAPIFFLCQDQRERYYIFRRGKAAAGSDNSVQSSQIR